MIKFLKENGYPMTIFIETSKIIDLENEFNGYQTTITNENSKEIAQFSHHNLRDRIHWAFGFFTALRMNNGN
jgi:hypothetical protein